MQLTIETKRHKPTAMFLRQELCSGVDDATGTRVELAQTGASLVLEVKRKVEGGEFEDGRTVETISIADLCQAWAAAVVAEES